MKNPILIALFFLSACAKENRKIIPPTVIDQNTPNSAAFMKYTIPAGSQYCDQTSYVPTSCSELSFTVKFDSSAIYKTTDPVNQEDINKLIGFSDNNSDHHSFSARFGWRWSNNALRLFGYTYNNGLREYKELGTIDIGAESNCSIKVAGNHYLFILNGHLDSMTRSSTSSPAIGYKLFPYFGGDEMAPHEISIWIRE